MHHDWAGLNKTLSTGGSLQMSVLGEAIALIHRYNEKLTVFRHYCKFATVEMSIAPVRGIAD